MFWFWSCVHPWSILYKNIRVLAQILTIFSICDLLIINLISQIHWYVFNFSIVLQLTYIRVSCWLFFTLLCIEILHLPSCGIPWLRNINKIIIWLMKQSLSEFSFIKTTFPKILNEFNTMLVNCLLGSIVFMLILRILRVVSWICELQIYNFWEMIEFLNFLLTLVLFLKRILYLFLSGLSNLMFWKGQNFHFW